MFQDLRLNVLTARGRTITPGADDFISAALPPDFVLDGTVGASTQVISRSSDQSATITVTCGSMSLGHAEMAAAYAEQMTAMNIGGSPVGAYVCKTTNGDTIAGIGVISKPTTVTGGTQSGSRAWTVILQQATYTPAVGLGVALAASGTI